LALIFTSQLIGADVDKYSRFWSWFAQNERFYSAFDRVDTDVELAFDRLAKELHGVNSRLTFEFGPKGAVREFVISADGNRDAFSDVTALASSAPALPNWKIVSFRPRRSPLHDVQYGKIRISVEETRYAILRSGGKLAVVLYNPGYDPALRKEWAPAFYLILDEALGEHDVETKVGFIEFSNGRDGDMAKHYDPDYSISKMADHFDAAWARLNHPVP
jgi:hypothetical protein